MFQALIHKVFGTRHEREMKRLAPAVARINELSEKLEQLPDEEIKAKTATFRERLERGEPLDRLLPEAFATVRVASMRTLGMRHFDVQLIGGIVLHRGQIAEMKTGEGKTLTATLPLYLNALAGKGAHLVTVNDYLARRDAEWMGRIYRWLGMSVGVIAPNVTEQQRQQAYHSDITYCTNNEVGFDYLRDNMKFRTSQMVQRGLNYAIVDEVDSILVDEARTPLIISGQAEQATEIYFRIDSIVRQLRRDEDYVVDEEHRSVTMADEGIEKVEKRLGIDNLFEPTNMEMLHHVNKALEAHTLYKKDERYIVDQGKVVIVDEFTGRLMPGRRWSDGLHQAIEAKEGVQIQNESITLATITFQNFFRMYGKLAGMTGTADTEAEEFQKIYKLGVTVIPTHRRQIRRDLADLVYRTEREKFAAIIDQIEECHEKGQPVLVGTVSVEKSEVISKILERKKIAHSVLNAKHHGKEAEIITQAGRRGSVTIATNMAGRGTDILLGGNPEGLARKVAPDEESQEYRDALARFREQCAGERGEVVAAGGLFVLGTERHESRRIDNQLRGRSGRQGDPGESRFFLSLEDELMRRFGADRIQGLMQRLGMEEGVPIEADMVSRAIENSQKRVEGRNFDIRKHLLEYDEVLDVQRKAVYALRRRILDGDRTEELMLDVLDEALGALLDNYANASVRPDEWDLDALARDAKDMFHIQVDASELTRHRTALEQSLWTLVRAQHDAKIAELEPVATRYNERFAQDADFKPKSAADVFYDLARENYLREIDKRWREHLEAMRGLRESVGLHGYAQKDPKQIYKREGFAMFQALRAEVNANVAKFVMRFVVRHDESLQRAGLSQVQARLAAQAAVLQAGQRTAASPRLTGENRGVTRVTTSTAPVSPGSPAATGDAPGSTGGLQLSGASPAVAPKPRRELPKIGRNDPCWCGSGKKYKLCHMKADADAAGVKPVMSGETPSVSGESTPVTPASLAAAGGSVGGTATAAAPTGDSPAPQSSPPAPELPATAAEGTGAAASMPPSAPSGASLPVPANRQGTPSGSHPAAGGAPDPTKKRSGISLV